MFCPLLYQTYVAQATMSIEDAVCLQSKCALWEHHTGTCGLVTSAYLQGIQASQKDLHQSEGG